nr:immunoglobulin heavy chain junction region [Mus musculus]
CARDHLYYGIRYWYFDVW